MSGRRFGAGMKMAVGLVAAVALVAGCGSASETAESLPMAPDPEVAPGDADAEVAAPGVDSVPGPEPDPDPDPGPGVDADVEAAVGVAFDGYRQALFDADGEAAADLVTEGTIAWYDELLVAGRSADARQMIDGMPLGDAMAVLSMRANYGEELLVIEDGRALFVSGVTLGLIGDVATLEITRVDLGEADEAFGSIGGQPILRFERSDQGWLVDARYVASNALNSADEVSIVAALSGGEATSRQEFLELLAAGYGSTWAELSTPLV